MAAEWEESMVCCRRSSSDSASHIAESLLDHRARSQRTPSTRAAVRIRASGTPTNTSSTTRRPTIEICCSTTIRIDPEVRDRLREQHPDMTLSDAVSAALDAEERAAFLDAEVEAERTYNTWFDALEPERQESIRARDLAVDDWVNEASRS